MFSARSHPTAREGRSLTAPRLFAPLGGAEICAWIGYQRHGLSRKPAALKRPRPLVCSPLPDFRDHPERKIQQAGYRTIPPPHGSLRSRTSPRSRAHARPTAGRQNSRPLCPCSVHPRNGMERDHSRTAVGHPGTRVAGREPYLRRDCRRTPRSDSGTPEQLLSLIRGLGLA